MRLSLPRGTTQKKVPIGHQVRGRFLRREKSLHPRLFCRERIWNMTLAIIGAINAHLRLRAPELRNPGIFYLSADDIGLPNSWVISPIAMPFNVHVMGTAPYYGDP